MLQDRFGRSIDYVRLSVTDRCDLRCTYCIPKGFKDFEEPADWLTFDEIERVMAAFTRLGTRRIRLTGGEPLLRRGISQLAARLAALPGLEDLSLSTNATQLARHMVTAEMLLDEKRLGEALAAVEAARVLSPNLTAALKLELKIRQLQNTPEPVLTLTEKLLKSDAISPEQARRYRLAAYREQLRQYIDPRELRQWWQKIPAQERQNPVLANAVAAHYVQLGNADAAAALLLVELGDTPSPEILQTLGQLADTVSESVRLDMVRQGERRLQSHSRDPDLLLMLGRLARAQQLWGKAQSYFEASLSIQPTLAAHAELARLLQALDRADEARRHFDACLELALAEV